MTELSASQFIWRFHQRTNLITIPAHVLFREMCNIKKSTGRTKLCGLKWRHKACLPWFSTAKLQFQTNGQHPEETLRRWPENVRCLSWWEKHAGWTVLGEGKWAPLSHTASERLERGPSSPVQLCRIPEPKGKVQPWPRAQDEKSNRWGQGQEPKPLRVKDLCPSFHILAHLLQSSLAGAGCYSKRPKCALLGYPLCL